MKEASNEILRMRASILRRYIIIGILLGLIFPIKATVFELTTKGLPFSFENILIVFAENALLYVVATAPVLLGFFALVAGLNRAKSEAVNIETANLLKHLEETKMALRYSNEELNQIYDLSASGIRVVYFDKTMRKCNSKFKEMAGIDMDRDKDVLCDEAFLGEACGTDQCPLEIIRREPQKITYEMLKHGRHGHSYYCACTISPFYNPEGELVGVLEEYLDITKRKALEEKLEHASMTDPLTGLFNRRGFMTFSEDLFDQALTNKKKLYVAYLDIDNMKYINDNFGHKTGDEVIQATVEIIRHSFRGSDVKGRLGGDEFAIFAECHEEIDGITLFKDRIDREIQSINDDKVYPFDFSVSVGIMACDPADYSVLDDILRLADEQMYRIKKARKNTRGGR